MSSIYKKGRDGYYYYQTYVYNSDSGKKNKRIFHSLKTKDILIAKQKQKKYDEKYKKLPKSKQLNKLYALPNLKIAWIVIITAITTFFFTRLFDSQRHEKMIFEQASIKGPPDLSRLSLIDSVDFFKNDTIKDLINLKKENIKILTSKTTEKVKLTKGIIPKYSIQLVEQISGIFEQGKVYVVVKEESSSNDLKGLSLIIKEKYPMFSNIIICFYSDTEIGRSLAKGIKEGINDEEQQIAWLAMYSFNPVEGEYFDDNPGGYLGAY